MNDFFNILKRLILNIQRKFSPLSWEESSCGSRKEGRIKTL